MKTYPITFIGALRSMLIGCQVIWHQYRCDVRERRREELLARRRKHQAIRWDRSHATWAHGRRRHDAFDELRSPVWLALVIFCVLVLVVDLTDSWPLLTDGALIATVAQWAGVQP